MQIHIAWLYPSAVVGCLIGMLVMALCAISGRKHKGKVINMQKDMKEMIKRLYKTGDTFALLCKPAEKNDGIKDEVFQKAEQEWNEAYNDLRTAIEGIEQKGD